MRDFKLQGLYKSTLLISEFYLYDFSFYQDSAQKKGNALNKKIDINENTSNNWDYEKELDKYSDIVSESLLEDLKHIKSKANETLIHECFNESQQLKFAKDIIEETTPKISIKVNNKNNPELQNKYKKNKIHHSALPLCQLSAPQLEHVNNFYYNTISNQIPYKSTFLGQCDNCGVNIHSEKLFQKRDVIYAKEKLNENVHNEKPILISQHSISNTHISETLSHNCRKTDIYCCKTIKSEPKKSISKSHEPPKYNIAFKNEREIKNTFFTEAKVPVEQSKPNFFARGRNFTESNDSNLNNFYDNSKSELSKPIKNFDKLCSKPDNTVLKNQCLNINNKQTANSARRPIECNAFNKSLNECLCIKAKNHKHIGVFTNHRGNSFMKLYDPHQIVVPTVISNSQPNIQSPYFHIPNAMKR